MPLLRLFTGKDEEQKKQKKSPYLVVHGYEIYENGRLGSLSLAVCEATLRMLEINPDMKAILVGGWHLEEAGAGTTIASAMHAWLVAHGIGEDRLITAAKLGLDGFMPPRDTQEEIALLWHMRRKLGIYGIDPFQFVAWKWHTWRIKSACRAWKIWNAQCIPVSPAPFKGIWKRRIMELCACVIQITDPHGMGWIPQMIRKGRTLANTGKPLTE